MRYTDVSPDNRIFIKVEPADPMKVESCTYSHPPVDDNELGLFVDDNELGLFVDDNCRPRKRGVFGGKRDGEDDFEQHKRDLKEAEEQER